MENQKQADKIMLEVEKVKGEEDRTDYKKICEILTDADFTGIDITDNELELIKIWAFMILPK